jgi:transporter family protein
VGVVIGLLFFLPFLIKGSQRLSDISAHSWIFLGLGGVVASLLGQICFYRALKNGAVSQAVPVGASYPVLACVLGILLLGEALTLGRACGIALVVAGTFLLR